MWDTAGILFDHKKGNSDIFNTWTNPREYFSGYTPEKEGKKTIISTSWKNLKMPHAERVDQWLSSTEGNRDIG